ncbi:uncharacterized protein LOC133205410 [Saccostrea echinata]|uniref:uncharacterized protein LOC133205410 n=1 Tax=Saccostrea echinata TaxID=191078 RepID=UPI002A80516C|nr:uncharacterized protein LOC133205410 [Saccostrea echinata]
MASESRVNLVVSEFREEVETNEVKVVHTPEKIQTFDSVDLGPGITEVTKFSKGIYSQGLVNISLLSANATQLRSAQSNNAYEYQTAVIGLISTSIALQVVILLLLSLLTMIPRDKNHTEEIWWVWKWLLRSRIKSVILFFVSVLTAINVFISAYQNV